MGVLSGDQAGSANKNLAFHPQHIDSCLDASLAHIVGSAMCGVFTSYIAKEPEGTVDGGVDATAGTKKTKSLGSRLARALGEDMGRIKPTDTLTSLGMDSLQSVEINNILRQLVLVGNAAVWNGKSGKLTVNDLRTTAWSDLCTLESQ